MASMAGSPSEMLTLVLLKKLFAFCKDNAWSEIVWNVIEMTIVANMALLWLFLRERKTLSASQVLGVNLVVMDLIYLSSLPVMVFETVSDQEDENDNRTHSDHSDPGSPGPRDIFAMFNNVGVSLLSACMCFERYLAVIRPVLYLRLRKWEYRMAVSAVVWVLTLSCCLAAGLVRDPVLMLLPVATIISLLLVLMLSCLGVVVWSLQQQSPAHQTNGNQVRSESPLKRQAVVNVFVVVVSAVVSYLPVLGMIPLIVSIYYGTITSGPSTCNFLAIVHLFPKMGVFIGPLFYLSKARHVFCLRGGRT